MFLWFSGDQVPESSDIFRKKLKPDRLEVRTGFVCLDVFFENFILLLFSNFGEK